MHHDLWMIFVGWGMRKVFDGGWNYGKQLVQAVALYILVVRFVAFFLASYVSQPSPIAGHSAGADLAPSS
jgi:hypothetical protein